MIVIKFGGTSVGSIESISRVEGIVRSRLDKRPLIVVSAFSGVTDSIIALANAAAERQGHEKMLESIIKRHSEIVKGLGIKNPIEHEAHALAGMAHGISTSGKLQKSDLDAILSLGERMSSIIIAAYLTKKGIKCKAYPAYDIGMLTDSNFGNADIIDETLPSIQKALHDTAEAELMVVTGFIGKDRHGNITTLGRGGSDYTASIIGAALGAKEIEIWTDVDGIMSADPKIVGNAHSIERVSYEEAAELAVLGAKVLHPKAIRPAVSRNIPVRILNTFNPSHPGTTVARDIKEKSRVISVALKRHMQIINIKTPEMFHMNGFLPTTFELTRRFAVPLDMISTSEANISLCIESGSDLSDLAVALSGIGEVEVKKDRAKISVVGKGMLYMPGILGKIFSTLHETPVEMTSSSLSEINQSFVVKEEHAGNAVRALHKELFA